MAGKTVIIGGVAGGATTAARLRRKDEERQIVLLERGEYISYANCGLPYYIGDVIKNRDSLLLLKPETMKARFNIDVRTENEVVAIHPGRKCVEVRNLKTGEAYEETYDDLVIATGSSPVVPPIPGIDGPDIHTLWTVSDTDRIKRILAEKKPKRAAVIGGGFIGLEMAENLHKAGVSVTVIEMQDQVMAPFDPEMAELLHENMIQNGVELLLGDGVAAFDYQGGRTIITLNSGKTVETDLVILSIGVRPNSSLAEKAGLTVNQRGGIVVDSHMRTSMEHIYAVGDVIEVEHYILGTKTMIPLAGPANKEARICADNLAGDEKEYRGTMGTSVARVFDYTAASTGVNEKTLKSMGKVRGVDYEAVLINQKSHAGYYPGAVSLILKLIFGLKGEIYGAQVVGQDGADKRIDTIATVMRLKGSVYDLEELELAYAPPYSSAKDPVNMLGFTAENVLDGLVSFMEYTEMDQLAADPEAKKDMVILDVTEEVERSVYHIPDSYHIPLGQLRSRLGELDRGKMIVVYCAVGVRAYNASRILTQNGFERVKVLAGGISFYKSMHHRDFENDRQNGNGAQEQRQEPVRELGPAEDPDRQTSSAKAVKIVDCCGLQCPGPIMKVHEAIGEIAAGEILEVSATDMGFARDIASWCRQTGNSLVGTERKGVESIVLIRKGTDRKCENSTDGCDSMEEMCGGGPKAGTGRKDGKTMVVFSGDMDKALASFIIANGAAAMGKPVTMFFTFWGLNILRKPEKQPVKKSAIEKMFGAMMPRGAGRLKLSKMNMGGMGTKMMKKVMAEKHVDTLESLMSQAMKNGVKLVACTMSMDVMGIRPEELIDGVELAGVASYLGDAENSNVNLFI